MGRPGADKYGIGKMQPGDSIIVPGKTPVEISSSVVRFRGQGKHYVTRRTDEGCFIYRLK